MKKYFLSIIILISFQIQAQEYYRMSASFTVKVKKSDGKMSLTKGTVYYDKNYKQLIYDITFPKKEKWVMRDTTLVKVRQNDKPEITAIPQVNEFTIFHLALNANLDHFGLNDTPYEMVKVEKKGDLVVSYWKIHNQKVENTDHIVLAKKNNRLQNVIIVGENNKIIVKQFFKDYVDINGFNFPSRIVIINYDEEGKKTYQVFEFKDIKVNDFEHDELYQYQ